MTWVIGATSLFGYSVIVSDIQVTYANSGHSRDVLKKVHCVGPHIAAGFAGDVPTGLSLLAYLSELLNPADIQPDEVWDPRWVAENWGPVARNLYADFARNHPVGETHILMAGTRSVPDRRPGELGSTVGCISVLKSPEFECEVLEGNAMATSIGCGSEHEPYLDDLAYIMKDPQHTYIQGELMRPGGHGVVIAQTIKLMVERNPLLGVSQHFHTTLVTPAGIEQYGSGGMPMVASNWQDLLKLLGDDFHGESLLAAYRLPPANRFQLNRVDWY